MPASQRHALSAKRVENWLFCKLAQQTGEPAVAAIVTDNVTPLSNAVVHYTWLSREDVLKRQHDLAGRYDAIIKDGYKSHCPAMAPLPDHLCLPDHGHGSRYVLKRSAVQSLSKMLREKILRKYSRSSGRLTDMIAFHNSFTLYSFAAIGFATGLRPGEDPIPHPRRIDRLSGFIVWSDKGRGIEERDRLLWLPPTAINQIGRYHTHVSRLRAALDRLGVHEGEALKEKGDEKQSLFLLDASKALKRSAQKEVASGFEKLGLPIRLNVWRHYLRTELVGVMPGDILMAFLGHWQRGQNPWDVYSGLDPQTYRAAISNHLPQLLKRDGWEAIWGYGEPKQEKPRPAPLGGAYLPVVR